MQGAKRAPETMETGSAKRINIGSSDDAGAAGAAVADLSATGVPYVGRGNPFSTHLMSYELQVVSQIDARTQAALEKAEEELDEAKARVKKKEELLDEADAELKKK
jgi:hypothetical protein